MKVLLVEDEEHKTTDLLNRLMDSAVTNDSEPVVAKSVREAVLAVLSDNFDLIVLDMALPTFSGSAREEGGGGVSQAIGGIEVLRALQSSGKKSRIIVVTQYPEIAVSGDRVKLSQISKVVSKRYGQNVLGAVLYSFKTPEWEANFDRLLESAKV
jgi:ActR/RegA family two-component response regulator